MVISRIPIVKAQIARGGVDALWRVATPVNVSTQPVTSEQHRIYDTITLKGNTSIIGATTDWTLPNTYVHTGTVVVKNEDSTYTYVVNTDYTVDYDAATITRAWDGHIPNGSIITVSYSWEEPMILLRSGNTRPLNTQEAVIYDEGTWIKGLLHIPKYESPLTKIGFFEMGDAIFTTTSLYKVKARGYGDYKYMTRDIIQIDDGTGPQIWRVLAKPETIQMASEFLAHKIHIRKLKEDEVLAGDKSA